MSDIIYVDKAEDFTGYINIIYGNGRGRRVNYSRVSGNRSKYKSVYEVIPDNNFIITKSNKFMLITKSRKGAFAELEYLNNLTVPSIAFKITALGSKEKLFSIIPYDEIPNKVVIDFDRYSRGYPVKIKFDELWTPENMYKDPEYKLRQAQKEQKEVDTETQDRQDRAD